MPWWFTGACALAQGPVINEVVPGGASGPDWVEVYNPGTRAVDLAGYTLVTADRTHRIDAYLPLKAHGHLVLWCDRHPERGIDHLDLKLPREGGSLLLIDPDRRSVRDIYSWRSLPSDVSLGRLEDGGRAWGYFTRPTPGASNQVERGAHRLLPAPVPSLGPEGVTCGREADSEVRYTLDGRTPDPASPLLPENLTLPPGSVITLRAFAADALPSGPVALTIPEENTGSFIALRADPDSLYGQARGILAGDGSTNFSRTGTDWLREAQVEWHDADNVRREDVRVGVSGSGTRGLPKKNLKLHGTEEIQLRADASPHAFLRNLFLETIARGRAQVEVQPSRPVPLYVNGRYQGLYRAMPAKNSAWLRALSGAESLDLIDGPGAHALKGDAEKHTQLLALLERGASLDTLGALMDVTSLLDLACFDLYSGRADHDLNTRCWRPREAGGRWRWILFDMDLWAPAGERTVERMCSSTVPEAPYMPWLLRHEELRPRLLARMSAWLATGFAPERAGPLADSLYRANEELMIADHARWKQELTMPAPQESIAALRAHITERPARLIDQLTAHTGQGSRALVVRVIPPDAGTIMLEGLPLTSKEQRFEAFAGAPIRLSAIPSAGYEFVGWQGTALNGASIIVDPGHAKNLRAVFRIAGSGD